MQLDLIAVVVEDDDPAIAFFTQTLGFDLVEGQPQVGGELAHA